MKMHGENNIKKIIMYIPYSYNQVCTQHFSLEGEGRRADPEAIYNLRLILKTMLQNEFISITVTQYCLQLHLYT
jgi:hypothetical protein